MQAKQLEYYCKIEKIYGNSSRVHYYHIGMHACISDQQTTKRILKYRFRSHFLCHAYSNFLYVYSKFPQFIFEQEKAVFICADRSDPHTQSRAEVWKQYTTICSTEASISSPVLLKSRDIKNWRKTSMKLLYHVARTHASHCRSFCGFFGSFFAEMGSAPSCRLGKYQWNEMQPAFLKNIFFSPGQTNCHVVCNCRERAHGILSSLAL